MCCALISSGGQRCHFPDNVVRAHHEGMTDTSAPEESNAETLVRDERIMLAAARRLAAMDPDIRSAMSEAWWAGIRVGMRLNPSAEVVFPIDPFSMAAMEFEGYAPKDH